jgi:hypothetical protein
VGSVEDTPERAQREQQDVQKKHVFHHVDFALLVAGEDKAAERSDRALSAIAGEVWDAESRKRRACMKRSTHTYIYIYIYIYTYIPYTNTHTHTHTHTHAHTPPGVVGDKNEAERDDAKDARKERREKPVVAIGLAARKRERESE